MDGRVKTLHPKVHGGILGRRGQDDAIMEEHQIQPIDMVVVNLYPFAQTVAREGCSLEDAVENIDIGGPTMVRSAAKNHKDVAIVVKSSDYDAIIKEMDDSWFARLAALTGLVGRVSAMIGVLMVAAVFLVIGNSVRLSIFARRDSINVQKLIGATDGFILRPFLYGGALLGFSGALLSLILSEILVLRLSSAVAEVAQVFGTKFDINGLSFDECLLLLLVCSMIGWVAAWLATVQHLRHFTPE